MPVRMYHPEHGYTNAQGTEVEWNQKHGWKIEEPPAPPVILKPTAILQQPRRGRPPKGF